MATVRAMTKTELQAKYEALLHNCNLIETKLASRTQELIELNNAYAKLATQFDELSGRFAEATRPAISPVRSAVAQISERRAAMQRAREEAMATGRYVKV